MVWGCMGWGLDLQEILPRKRGNVPKHFPSIQMSLAAKVSMALLGLVVVAEILVVPRASRTHRGESGKWIEFVPT